MNNSKEPNSSDIALYISRLSRSAGLIFVTLSLPFYLKDLGLDIVDIGVVYAFIIAFSVAESLALGYLGDITKYKYALLIADFASLIGTILIALAFNIYLIILGMLLAGISGSAGALRGSFAPGLNAYILSTWKEESKQVKVLSRINLLSSIGSLIGSMLLEFNIFLRIPEISFLRSMYLVSALLIFISLISLTLIEENRHENRKSSIMTKKSRSYAKKILIINLINGAGMGLAIPLLPLFFSLIFNINISKVGFIYFMSYILTAFGSYISYNIYSRLKSPEKIILFSRVASGSILAFIPFARFYILAIILYSLRSFIAGIGAPARSILNIRGLDQENYGIGGSIAGGANRISQTSSLISGYLADISLPLPIVLGGVLQVIVGFLYYEFTKDSR
ncbi:MAG: MFS transporter [Candidatus Micrarchaeota archaeon]|nr:MAG: MFS transporter [Candidatus Micrarchaeota archaeon]